MKREYYSFYVIASAALMAAPFCLPAQALPIAGTTSGVFVNPLPTGSTTTGVETNDLTFGDATGFATGPNRFTFSALPFNTQTDTDFQVGTFTYFNGTTLAGTTIDAIDLQVGLDFTTPSAGLQTSSFGLDVITTTNTGVPDLDADAVLLPNSFSSTIFMLGDTEYTLQLLGFRNVEGDGFLTSTNTRLNVREGATASAQLFGRVTADLPETPTSVPEPLSILSLFGIASAALPLRRKESR
jgi:hypothetical protein